MSEEPDIPELLREANGMADVVREFAWKHLEAHREALRDALAYQRREGRALAFCSDDPEPVRVETERRIEEAKGRFRAKLLSLLAWARERGRM
jgi:hypothetical protein